jgi:hypothetical protein
VFNNDEERRVVSGNTVVGVCRAGMGVVEKEGVEES